MPAGEAELAGSATLGDRPGWGTAASAGGTRSRPSLGIAVRHTKSGNWLTGLKILATDSDPESDGIEEVQPLDLDASGWHQG